MENLVFKNHGAKSPAQILWLPVPSCLAAPARWQCCLRSLLRVLTPFPTKITRSVQHARHFWSVLNFETFLNYVPLYIGKLGKIHSITVICHIVHSLALRSNACCSIIRTFGAYAVSEITRTCVIISSSFEKTRNVKCLGTLGRNF